MDMEAAMKRIPPHSAEAEQAVLGAMLMNKEAISMASEIITGEDFYQTAYGILFDCIVEMFQQGKPVDLITLQDYLKEKRCSTGDQQHGICERSSHAGTDIRQCRYLCKDRPGKICDAEAH